MIQIYQKQNSRYNSHYIPFRKPGYNKERIFDVRYRASTSIQTIRESIGCLGHQGTSCDSCKPE